MNKDQIKEAVKELAQKLSVSVDDVEVVEDAETGHQTYTIKTKESGLLIGSQGTVFSALSHIARKIIAKRIGVEEKDATKYSIDVNDYREKSKTELEQRARVMADRAVSFKCDIEMEPMSSYARMCIHSYLKGRPNIKTESAGLGKARHVVVKYIADADVLADSI